MEFFNGLGRKFTNVARTVQERTRESVESTLLSADLRSAHSELERQLIELGRAYYASVTEGDCEVPEELVRRVRESMDQVDRLTGQRARSQARCSSCGSVQSAEARFCSNCGRPMPENPPSLVEEPVIDAQYCAECGAMRQGESRFCAVCGGAFDAAGTSAELPAAPAIPKPEPLEEPESGYPYAE